MAINPKDDQLCASIISNVINRGIEEGQSRTASSPASTRYRNQAYGVIARGTREAPIIRNEAYALRQKLFPNSIASAIEEESESRAAAIPPTQGTKSRNQAYELRKILFGLS